MRRLAPLALIAAPAFAEGERAGDFDYYVLSLSWSPTWCALEGAADGSPQCDPARRETAAMADVMGTSGLAWHQWKKHGRCAGLPPEDYFALARRAYASVTLPDVFERLDVPVRLPASVVEEAFLEANPGWTPDMITVTCTEGRIQEARICLTADLEPRPCAPDVRRDCRIEDALLDPIP